MPCLQRARQTLIPREEAKERSLLPTGIQWLPRLQEQDKQPQARGSREPQHLTGSSFPGKSEPPHCYPPPDCGTLGSKAFAGSESRQELTPAPSPRADGSRGAQAVTASGTSYAKESHVFGEITQFSTALSRVQQVPLPKQHRLHQTGLQHPLIFTIEPEQ